MKKFTIAIDGPAGSGKSTAAKGLAARLGYIYIDTGAMYRGVAWKCIYDRVSIYDEKRVSQIAHAISISFKQSSGAKKIIVDGHDVTDKIRQNHISEATSQISSYLGVREAMTAKQREMGREGGVIMEGRDIGTVVFPDADYKFFIVASPEERAKRRCKELMTKGESVDFHSMLASMKKRDERDSTRELAPLISAHDAIKIDSTHLSIDELLDFMIKVIDYA